MVPINTSRNPSTATILRDLIKADREMSNVEVRTTNRSVPTSTFEIQHSTFASLPSQLFYTAQPIEALVA